MMNPEHLRRRLLNDGKNQDEVEDLLSEIAEQRHDEDRDHHTEELYKEQS